MKGNFKVHKKESNEEQMRFHLWKVILSCHSMNGDSSVFLKYPCNLRGGGAGCVLNCEGCTTEYLFFDNFHLPCLKNFNTKKVQLL